MRTAVTHLSSDCPHCACAWILSIAVLGRQIEDWYIYSHIRSLLILDSTIGGIQFISISQTRLSKQAHKIEWVEWQQELPPSLESCIVA